MIQLTDAAHATIYVQSIAMIVIPSLLAEGDGKSRVYFPGGIIEVTRQEAERLGALLVSPHCAQPLEGICQ
jgi:cytochrome b561